MASETVNSQKLQLEHCKATGGVVFRNNSGVFYNEAGQPVRCGLGNISAQHNKEVKSSDYIGITPTLIQPHMVGFYLGVFTAYEAKRSGWHLTPGDERGNAQAKFHQIVRDNCGYAGFVIDPTDIYPIIGRERPR